eukprot:6242788-Amphidinium_carterae.1
MYKTLFSLCVQLVSGYCQTGSSKCHPLCAGTLGSRKVAHAGTAIRAPNIELLTYAKLLSGLPGLHARHFKNTLRQPQDRQCRL